MALTLRTERLPDATLLAASGDIDVATAGQLRDALAAIMDDAPSGGVVLDLGGTDFLDSSALGVLVGVNKRLDARQDTLTVVCDKPQLLRVFEITRLDQVIRVVPTLEAVRR